MMRLRPTSLTIRLLPMSLLLGVGLLAIAIPLEAQGGRGAPGATKAAPASAAGVTRPTSPAAPGGAWAMPDASDLVERVIRRIVTQDKPAAVPIGEFKLRAFGREATLIAVRRYLGRDVDLPASVYTSVSDWTNAVDKLPAPECADADTTCIPASTVWLAVTKFERGDLPHEMNVWYTTSFTAKPHDQLISSRYSFCERWLRVGGTWKYDGFIRVTSG